MAPPPKRAARGSVKLELPGGFPAGCAQAVQFNPQVTPAAATFSLAGQSPENASPGAEDSEDAAGRGKGQALCEGGAGNGEGAAEDHSASGPLHRR